MKTAILLGAGSSIPAGFPSTEGLTKLVLSGKDIHKHTSGLYYKRTDGLCVDFAEQLSSQRTQLVKDIVQKLSKEAECYYSDTEGRTTNYEDIFYLAAQVHDDLWGEMENPAVRPFVNNLRDQIGPLIDPQSIIYFKTLMLEPTDYIADVVRIYLSHEPKQKTLRHLDLIRRGCSSGNITSISTLCHDTHVETYLRDADITLSDGFSEEEAGVRYWHGDFSTNEKIPFLKLHGSINWFRFRPLSDTENPWRDERIGIPLNSDPEHTQTIDGVRQTPLDGRPLLLIGTFNKILDYSKGIFDELFYRFRSTTEEANQMIICGYGFGDKGINNSIIEWYHAKRGRRFIVIHPDINELLEKARPAIQHNWTIWDKEDNLILIKEKFEDVDIDEFEEKYFSD